MCPCLCIWRKEHRIAKRPAQPGKSRTRPRVRMEPLRGPERTARYRFRARALLEAALTHRSYVHENPDGPADDFERLEFLGDAVVGLVVGEHLYRRFPKLREGELTALRASLVSGNGLAPIGARLVLPGAARLGRGEEESGGRQRPGLAASLFEALVGAVYIDGGLDAAREVVERAMSTELRRVRSVRTKTNKTQLQELVQARHLPLPVYRTVEMSGPEHRRDFVVKVEVNGRSATGSGPSKRDAEEAAAAALLALLEP